MILCHKCAGILTNDKDEDTSGIGLCCCISGWVRGFEPVLDRQGAIRAQIKWCETTIEWQERRNAQGDDERIQKHKERIARLTTLLVS